MTRRIGSHSNDRWWRDFRWYHRRRSSLLHRNSNLKKNYLLKHCLNFEVEYLRNCSWLACITNLQMLKRLHVNILQIRYVMFELRFIISLLTVTQKILTQRLTRVLNREGCECDIDDMPWVYSKPPITEASIIRATWYVHTAAVGLKPTACITTRVTKPHATNWNLIWFE